MVMTWPEERTSNRHAPCRVKPKIRGAATAPAGRSNTGFKISPTRPAPRHRDEDEGGAPFAKGGSGHRQPRAARWRQPSAIAPPPPRDDEKVETPELGDDAEEARQRQRWLPAKYSASGRSRPGDRQRHRSPPPQPRRGYETAQRRRRPASAAPRRQPVAGHDQAMQQPAGRPDQKPRTPPRPTKNVRPA